MSQIKNSEFQNVSRAKRFRQGTVGLYNDDEDDSPNTFASH